MRCEISVATGGGPNVVYGYVHVIALPGTRSVSSVATKHTRIVFWSASRTCVLSRLVFLRRGRYHCVVSEESPRLGRLW